MRFVAVAFPPIAVLALLIVGIGVFGLLIGSFLNVVAYRVPRGLSIVAPGSFCPSCNTPLSALDNIPLLSYLALGGRCRHCGAPISARYPILEFITGALFAGTAARFRFSWAIPAYLVFAAGLVVLSAIDLERRVLPRLIVALVGSAVVLLLVLASASAHDWDRFGIASACAAVWFAIFLAIHQVDRRLLGFGDVRLAVVLGFALGWLGVGYAVIGFLLANLVGAAVGIALMATGHATRKTALPFGPFLATGCELAVLAGPALLLPFHGR